MSTHREKKKQKHKTLENVLVNTGSIAFLSITFPCCQYVVLKIDICSPRILEGAEGGIQLRNYYRCLKWLAVGCCLSQKLGNGLVRHCSPD